MKKAILEICHVSKSFRHQSILSDGNMTVYEGELLYLCGKNGSGKSTTEKMICGLLLPSGGSIKLFGKDYTDVDIRAKIGVLIEAPGCFPNMSVWNNMKLQAANLGMKKSDAEIQRILKMVRMEGAAGNKYKNCSLGMKQRIGIAMALLGSPELLVLDEPINGLDADGMRIMREVLCDLAEKYGVTILISSHILSELEKIATHYGIIRGGKMIAEMTADELEADCRTYVALQCKDINRSKQTLACKYSRVEKDEAGYIRVYDAVAPEEIVLYLYESGILVNEVKTDKISLEEYYIDLMKEGR